jgi:hypothetical protein
MLPAPYLVAFGEGGQAQHKVKNAYGSAPKLRSRPPLLDE